MTTLEARARSASAAVQQSVDAGGPYLPFDALVRRHFWGQLGKAAFAGAAIVLVLIMGAFLRGPDPEAEVTEQDTPDPIVEEVAPVVPDPTEPSSVDDLESAPGTTLPTGDDPGAPPVVVVPRDVGTPPTTVEVDTTPPGIVVTSPRDGAHFEEKMIRFEGTTEPGATVAAGRYTADVDGTGNWSIVLVLSPGANGAGFTATDPAGNASSARITVYFDPPPPPKDDGGDKEPKPPKVDFTAHAKYGSCDLSPPYDVYWGTASPGSKVSIVSEYGSGSVRANEKGDWEIKVFFPEAPKGKVFVVKAKDESGHKKTFEFVSYAAD